MKVAVVGAGWAGCAAAVEALRLGHQVTVFEAARVAGGRARRLELQPPSPLFVQPFSLDNGQHILIGAYTETLRLMAELGMDTGRMFLRLPLTLLRPDGSGLSLPRLPAPADALAGILRAGGWSLRDKLSLLRVAAAWQLGGFKCPPQQSVSELCQRLSPAVMSMLVEPLCVSALNTPPARASGQVFLRVIHDSLFAASGASNLLLPRIDLSAALPDAALAWLTRRGGDVRLAARVEAMSAQPSSTGWQIGGELFDQAVLACPPVDAARLVERACSSSIETSKWLQRTRALRFEAITTVYAWAGGAQLHQPMLALPSGGEDLPHAAPAQFVFDRSQLGGPPGLLAFVVSASQGDSATLTRQVLAQGQRQLGLKALEAIKTIVEKRATFACVPGLLRPATQVAPGLLACGDYVEGPYPATLEGAVRSGLQAARQLGQASA